MKKILVLGSGGMAGHVITTHLKSIGHDVTNISAKNKLDDTTILLDVTDKNEFENLLTKNEYDVIINCIGILVEQSEKRKDLASYLNAYLPHYLENKYKDSPTKLIHLSTDCVFSGKNAPYAETSAYDGEIFYDRSKALGEVINQKDLTFRMSIIGPDMQKQGIGLFNWFFHQTGNINGYTTAMWNGITTITLAKAIKAAIEEDLVGLYHLVPNTNISKHDLLSLLKKIFLRNDITITPTDGVVIDKTLINTRTDFKFKVPDYPEMIQEMKGWINDNPRLYPSYERKNK